MNTERNERVKERFKAGVVEGALDAAYLRILPAVETDLVETVWTTGAAVRNEKHQCGAHMMEQ